MKKLLPFCVLFICVPLYSQSNDVIDVLLSQSPARYGETCYLALTAAGRLSESATPADAFLEARDSGFVTAGAGESDPVRLDEFSLLVMKAFGMNGGIMYSLFPVKRYAFRELVSIGAVSTTETGSRLVSGDEVIRIMAKVLEVKEASL